MATQACDYVDHGFSAFTEFVDADSVTRFIGASSGDAGGDYGMTGSLADNCLKDLTAGLVYYREQRVGTAYVQGAYSARVMSGALDFSTGSPKTMSRIEVERPTATAIGQMALRVGSSTQAADPYTSPATGGPICWSTSDVKNDIKPDADNQPVVWNVYKNGRFLYFDLTVDPVKGTAFDLSRISLTVMR